MILYRVTVAIDPEKEEEWLQWMRKKHILDVMDTGYFVSYNLERVVDPERDENGHAVYVIEYGCEGLDKFRCYCDSSAAALQAEHTEKYEGYFTASRLVLETVDI